MQHLPSSVIWVCIILNEPRFNTQIETSNIKNKKIKLMPQPDTMNINLSSNILLSDLKE